MASTIRDQLKDVVGETIKTLHKLSTEASQKAQDSIEDFIASPGKYLAPAMTLHTSMLTRLNITCMAQLDDLFKTSFQYSDIQELKEDLMQAEEEWDTMLSDIDKKLQGDDTGLVITEGSQAPIDITLVEASSSREVTLADYIGKDSVLLILLRHSL
ncbi:uncharacterized protein LOC102806350 [Saccoglossus kowalevskii]|uniref:Uncharacterized protein LOC102806350 n=1 Tax=Saccoglossus kowalevskii TaxID=10224 RepID=A0ABM0MXP8_SACKO|nr:PREDICTED: uncharacterized protein LOC102806350 [Saccoglossus kowalevskii]